MQANLVFTPYTLPSLPLGISAIKAYVQERSDFAVTCYDLNAQWHADLITGIRDGTFNLKDHDQETFQAAAELFRSRDDRFFDREVYHGYAATFLGNLSALYGVFHGHCNQAVAGKGPVPHLFQRYVRLLLANDPDVIGFSGLYDLQISFSVLAARLIRQARPSVHIIFGGSACASNHEKILGFCGSHTYVALNEGEETFLAFLSAIARNADVRDIPGLAVAATGGIRTTPPAIVKVLDSLPFPDFSDFDLSAYFSPEPVIPVLTSRGCYWRRCTFCTHYKSYTHTYRKASVERVVDELAHHADGGLTYFTFVDEMIPARRFEQIGKALIRRGVDIHYYALAKPTADFTKPVFDVMAASGCRYILWGVESGSQRILDLIDKGTRVHDMATVLGEAASAGIRNHLFMIVGFPSENREELLESLNFLYDNRTHIHMIHHSIFNLEKGSRIHDDPRRFFISKIHPPGPSGITYELSRGISRQEAREFSRTLAENFFHHFAVYSIYLGHLRDHALLIYAHPERAVFDPTRRKIPAPETIIPT